MDQKPKIAVIGGGVAGATAAVHLGELGIDVHLIERKNELVNGPPICHLHAGGNLYREISENQCIELLRQSIESVRLYPHTINVRPTVIAVPVSDSGTPQTIIDRLDVIKRSYSELVITDPGNKVIGEPDDYYKLYTRTDLEKLQSGVQPGNPQNMDDWVIPFARSADLSKLKFPVIVVQEYGWSVFRLGASATLDLQKLPNANLHLNSELKRIAQNGERWVLQYLVDGHESHELEVDYLINACGYETGIVDDLVAYRRKRYVEFKAAYVTEWKESEYQWPEIIFHGERGTPQGMAQLTPYADGIFQLHGMTEDITLFKGGLVASHQGSSQPALPEKLNKKLKSGWNENIARERTEKAIDFIGQYIPEFYEAHPKGLPLFGAQQIPGNDASLRASDVSFDGQRYARIEIVKGSSAYEAVRKIVQAWNLVPSWKYDQSIEELHPCITSLSPDIVEQFAIQMAVNRGYPAGLAKAVGVKESINFEKVS
ncbi:FAD-dependent oxidoreductase [Vibrio salinus]|uniref:FAD-dependent oxidoreductase n=1 Tax=Vibrio salinus TaxID=2899784 RepID=UPI001E3824A7|nr:FAD-dependent oxidoreductase [Vibrio salinus]MCE0496046.1 FAD-dependent oxidoreductase [Vibrio salinus]